MFYHVRVLIKPEWAKDVRKTACEHDLSREDIVNKIALPFTQGKQFFCGGTLVNPSRVEEIRFNRTEESSQLVFTKMREHRINQGIVSPVRPADLTNEGQDITREILEEVTALNVATVQADTHFTNKAESYSNRVFIVHGHDHKAVEQAELLLHRCGLVPVILKDAPSGGRTVIEKFEAHSNVGAAIVLLTPDDMGGKDASQLTPRARQNVIWEWGYLVRQLGRSKVICIYKGGIEIPSDLNGLVTIHIVGDLHEKTDEIKRELRAAGFAIS